VIAGLANCAVGERAFIRLGVLVAAAVGAIAASTSPDIAYTRDGVLYLATSAGDVVRTVKARLPIGRFTVSPDLTKVVFVPPGHDLWGGPLYLLRLKSNDLRKLSGGPYWPPGPDKGDHEVHDDPEFSPDGVSIVFAVHNVPLSGETDVVEASGPLAVMELRTGKVRLLQSTLKVDGPWPAFTNRPHWSPDGTQILVSFENEFAVVSADGKTLKIAAPQQLPDESNWSTALGWIGNRCISFGVGNDGVVRSVKILHLVSMKPEDAAQRFGFALEDQSGIESFAVSRSLLLVGRKTESQLYDIRSHRFLGRFPASARLLSAGRSAKSGCE
jgi:hypothetical protein